ncbi:hypothetical protein HXX76_012312 [Chlamydomonas incerta]|uniref:Uncharacterized protein n=1 Tax=Chlamydomonas incerta TaxID=51695 RepID=A0A835VVT0_CHLIN|nr:hypothetical protein HXX76_012312 [Chlamydomonas incerta]|eukprot:KAG2427663.1 hypothetical protein HXX76_012312 [Chlamydomonas incerta]
MESIKGHPEYVETVFGEAIVARDESLVVLASASGLGPPDLCWLQKAPKSALTGATGEAKGYYHYVLGGNASSSAAVAAYFATLTAMVEPPTFLQGLFSTTETRIERGFYCCYDPLSRLDVRCELCIPGGVVCGALDCEGNVHDVTPDLWRNCVVATFLRSELYDAELVSYSSAPVARHPPLPGAADESRLLSAVAGLYEDGVVPEGLEALTVDQAGGVAPEHSDVVLHCLLHYFARRQRWGTALEFFARLCSSYPPAALYVAAVQRECGLYDEALATLSRAVEEAPTEPLLLAALATECLYSDQLEASLRFATRAVRLRPLLRPAWLALARAHVRLGAGGAALVVLNLVPPPPLPGREEAMLHVVVAPEPKSTTRPALPAFDLDVAAARQVLAEEAIVHPGIESGAAAASGGAAGSSGALGAGSAAAAAAAANTLPGALMVPRDPPDAAACPDTAPLRITKAVLAAVYTVLQELVAVSGWDGFLQLRSGVFVMHADSDVLREQQREAEDREEKLRLLHRQLSATLPLSPGRAGGVAPQPAPFTAMSRRPPPEGVDYEAQLDEAVAMGLSEFPEHLEEAGYDDPRIAAAREAQRRHLRAIAERQAALEAAEGGAYADDEGGSSSGGGGAGSEPGGAAGGRGRRRRAGRKAAAAAGGAGAAAPFRGLGPGGEEDEEEEGLNPEEVEARRRHLRQQQEAFDLEADVPGGGGGGIIDASAFAAAEQQQLQHEQPEHEQQEQARAQQQQQEVRRASEMTAPAAATTAPSQPRGAPGGGGGSSWWGTFFGGGGAPQWREPGPLGEAREAGGGARRVMPGALLQRLQQQQQQEEEAGGLQLALAAPASGSGCRSSSCVAEAAGAGDWWSPAQGPGRSGAGAAAGAAAWSQGVACCALSPLERRAGATASGRGTSAGAGVSSPPTGGSSSACAAAASTSYSHSSGNSGCGTNRSGGAGSGLAAAVLGRLLGKLREARQRRAAAGCRRRLQRLRLAAAAELVATCPELAPYRPLAPLLAAAAAAASGGAAGDPLAARAVARRRRCPLNGTAGGAGAGGAGASRLALAAASVAAPAAVAEATTTTGADHGAAAAGGSPPPAGRPQLATGATIGTSAANPGTAAATAPPQPQPGEEGYGHSAAAAAGAGAGGHAAASAAVGSDGFPLVLQNADADRQMVAEGLDVTELGAKRLCVRWLDELIVALWHDLQAFLDWKALDTELAEAGCRCHAEIVAGTAPPPSPADYARAGSKEQAADGADGQLPPPPALPALSATEWLRRALLAERLHHEGDALAAYQAAVMTPPPAGGSGAAPAAGGASSASAAVVFAALSGGGPGCFSAIAWEAIMRLAPAAEPRDTAWALRGVAALMAWLEARAPAGGAIPFTSGFLAPGATAAAAAAGAVRAAPAAAAAAASAGAGSAGGAGGKLAACPLVVVQCLFLVAAVLGEEGVAELLAAQPPGGGAAAKPLAAAVSAAAGGRPVQAAAAAMLRSAVAGAAAARAAAAVAGGASTSPGGAAAAEAAGSSGGGAVQAGQAAAAVDGA